jgi:hypothetical protein
MWTVIKNTGIQFIELSLTHVIFFYSEWTRSAIMDEDSIFNDGEKITVIHNGKPQQIIFSAIGMFFFKLNSMLYL